MAQEKTKRWIVHAVVYFLLFLFCSPSPAALAVIVSTHAVIDRLRLAKYNAMHLLINHLALRHL